MATPRPGRPVRGSATGRPLMAALDLFGRRWVLRLVWELHPGAMGFRPLRERCDGMSSSVLRERLLDLTAAGLVHQLPDASYALTPLGEEAYQAMRPLSRWSERWAAALAEPGTAG